ncbi:hypothetical protein MTR67_031407 [Solanum verrucosum]|uniref:Uncharacterized protein n=1 Tax=Solanum verrucosum TaxID=315347 RepID=A0AAF0U2H5_SOLVR|nr:hypothetical protein MTR67_031407 [Solanum verrucosum]
MSNDHPTRLYHTRAHETHQEHTAATSKHETLGGWLKIQEVGPTHKQPPRLLGVSQKAQCTWG